MVFSIGDKVYAKGHKSNLWFAATVTQVSDSDTYSVTFDDGSVSEELNTHEIASEGRFRRGRSRSRSRSRSRGRSKSLARKAKQSPSPSRKVKQTSSSPSRKTSKVESSPSRKSTRVAEDTKAVTSKLNKSSSSSASTQLRQSARIAEKISRQESGEGDITETKRTVTTTTTTVTTSGTTNTRKSRPLAPFFGSFIGMILMPVIFMSFVWVCTQKSCRVTNYLSLNKLIPRKLTSYWDCNMMLIYSGFLVFQVLLSLLPVGRVLEGQKTSHLQTRSNGFFGAVVTMGLFAAMVYYKCGVTYVYKKYHQMAVTQLGFAFVWSTLLYIKGRNAKLTSRNEEGNTGCISHDFFMGREVNPRFGFLEMKIFLQRIAIISTLCVIWVVAVQGFEKTGECNHVLMLVVVMQSIYLLDFLVFEEGLASTMFAQRDGCGFMLVTGVCTTPIVLTLQPKYILEHPVSWSYPWLGFYAALFAIGYIIKRGSDSQKANFRRNPHHPALANLETMPTTGGKRLLVSGWWGLVRHPNYLGEIIMTVAFTLPCGCASFVPYIPILMLILFLCVRAKEDGVWCRQKHGAPWETYCKRVKYNIVPYVY